MGWTFPYSTTTKKRLVDEILSDYRHHPNWKIIKTALVGSCFWMALHSLKTDEKFIVLYLMEKHDGTYGYKDMDETMHPFFYNCPVSLLDMTTSPKNEANPWRIEMRKKYAEKTAKRNERKANPAKVGDMVTVANVPGYYKVESERGPRSFLIRDVKTNRVYKCAKHRLVPVTLPVLMPKDGILIPNPANL